MELPTGFSAKGAGGDMTEMAPVNLASEAAPPCEPMQVLLITSEHAGWKLAKYVSTQLPNWSRNAAANCAKDGMLRVNGERSGANRVLEVGDQVGVHAEPPKCEAPDGPELSADEIAHLVRERMRAKAARDFAAADSVYHQLINSKVRLDDRTKSWTAPGGLAGKQVASCTGPSALLLGVCMRERF